MSRLEKIENVLKNYDLIGLIDLGAPDNEYDFEAKELFERLLLLDNIRSCNQVQEILVSLFETKFSQSKHSLYECCLKPSKEIFAIMK